jgi:hypothetical protein
VGREVVGGAAGCGGDDQSVTHEPRHPLHPVDRQTDVGRVAGEAGRGDLVEGKGVSPAPVAVGRRHPQRVNDDRGGGGNAFNQVVWPVLVHEESDGPAVHPKDRPTELEVLVDCVEEQAVAAEGHDNVAVAGVDQIVAGGEFGLGRAPGLSSTPRRRCVAWMQPRTWRYPLTSSSESTPGRWVGFCSGRGSSPGSRRPRRGISSRGGTGEQERDELGDRDTEIGQERGQDRPVLPSFTPAVRWQSVRHGRDRRW